MRSGLRCVTFSVPNYHYYIQPRTWPFIASSLPRYENVTPSHMTQALGTWVLAKPATAGALAWICAKIVLKDKDVLCTQQTAIYLFRVSLLTTITTYKRPTSADTSAASTDNALTTSQCNANTSTMEKNEVNRGFHYRSPFVHFEGGHQPPVYIVFRCSGHYGFSVMSKTDGS